MIEITFPLLVAITIGITEVFKRLMENASIVKRVTPAVSLLLGLLLAMGFYGLNMQSMAIGLVIGLTSCGLWSSSKAVVKG